jgi:hypothetical protein
MRRKVTLVAAAVVFAATLFLALPVTAQFPPVVPGIDGRPAILLETDFYVYGPGTGFTDPEVNVTLDNRGYNAPASLYLYWENRSNGQRRYYNVRTGFGTAETDLFGTSRPARLFVPNLTDFQLFGPAGAFGPVPNNIPSGTGQYQFVLEVRDADSGDVISRGNAMYNQVDGVVPVSGDINGGNWTANNAYFLATPVNVTGGVLNIEPGTIILGSQEFQGTLVIRQGAQINANGTADEPIIFTSELPVGQRGPGDWGGLVINGFAPTNQQNPTGEGDSGPYGGNDPNDSSGTLRYVRVEFAGIRFSDQNELNGIALQGVGRGTTIDHVQVHFNQDDGIEFFGGTVDAKYVLITGAEDDSLDWTFGWNGRLQHFVAIQLGQEGDFGIEADSFRDAPDTEPRSNPTIANGTWIGLAGTGASGFLLRRGTGVTIRNAIVTRFTGAEGPVIIDGDASNALVGTLLTIDNSIFFNNTGPNPLPGLGANNIFSNPRLADPLALIPDIAPRPGSPARGNGVNLGGFFDNVNYIGGVNPNDSWIDDGWTTFADN